MDAVRQTDTFGDFQFAYHYGSILSPYIEGDEPLRVECLHFLECVRERSTPLTDGRNGLAVVEAIEAAQESLRKGGSPVSIAKVVSGRTPQRWRPAFPADVDDANRAAEKAARRRAREANGAGKPRKAHRKAIRRAEKAATNGKSNGNGNGNSNGNGNGKAGKNAAKVHDPVHEEV